MTQAAADFTRRRQDGGEANPIHLQEVRIALAGNPNCGKTTAFNEYTGTHQHVGNYPGVTVDKKEGFISLDGVNVRMVDLPGTYSLTAYSQEEIVTRAVLAPARIEEKPLAVIDVVDTSALERNLFLTVQIREMGLPVVLACNMMDEARKAGIHVDVKKLSEQLGIPVVPTVARSGEGLKEALREAIAVGRIGLEPLNISYGPDLDPVLTRMERLITDKGLLTDRYPARWVALKILENDTVVLEEVGRLMPDVSAALLAERHRGLPLRLHPQRPAHRCRAARIHPRSSGLHRQARQGAHQHHSWPDHHARRALRHVPAHVCPRGLSAGMGGGGLRLARR